MTGKMLFARDYAVARSLFLDGAAAAGAGVEAWPVAGAGPDGGALFTDVARIGPATARRLLLITSGTHGNEGHCGSAVQSDLLLSSLPLLLDPHGGQLPADFAIVLIHAVNPWGFAHARRQTEANVDLNRNFRDWSITPPDRPVYAELHPSLCPTSIDAASEAEFVAMAGALIEEHGIAWVQARLSEGQWSHSDGHYYGGAGPAPENLQLHRIMSEHLQGVEEALLIDVHTGMGAYGDHILLAGTGRATEEGRWLAHAFPPQRLFAMESDGEAVGGRWPTLDGKMTRAIQKTHPEINLHALSIEFGTFNGSSVFMAERRENWAWRCHGAGTAEQRKQAETLLGAMVPDDPLWQARVIAGARATVTDGLRALVGEGPER